MSREDELKIRLEQDKGDPAFAELADLYMAEGKIGEALTTLFGGLSANPGYQVGRLILARLFLHLGYAPFAVREIQTLRKERPEIESLTKLLEAIAPGSSEQPGDTSESLDAAQLGSEQESAAEEATLAEGDFEIDILEDLEEKKS